MSTELSCLVTRLAKEDPGALFSVVLEAVVRYHEASGSDRLDDVVAYLTLRAADRAELAEERGRLRAELDDSLGEYGFSLPEEAAALDGLWCADGKLDAASAEAVLSHLWAAHAYACGTEEVDPAEVARVHRSLSVALAEHRA